MNTKVLTAHVPLELAERIDEYAEQMERPRGWIVKQALAEWLYWEDEKRRMIREGLADIDAGHVIEHEAIVAWAESLATDAPLPPPTTK